MDQPTIEKIISAVTAEISKQSRGITLDSALALAEKIKAKAQQQGISVAVAVNDGGARPVLCECMDGALIAAYDVAVNKAFTSAALKMSTAQLKKLAQPNAPLYGIQYTNDGKIVIFGGGEPLLSKSGALLGGLGVSGGTEEQDTALAAYGRSCFEGDN